MVLIVIMNIVNMMSIMEVYVQANTQVFVMIQHFNVIVINKITLFQLELTVLLM